MNSRRLLSLLALLTIVFSSQLIGVTQAHADPDAPSDLMAMSDVIQHNQLWADIVCNQGPSDVKSFTIETSNDNYIVDFLVSLPSEFQMATAEDTGSVDFDTLVWTGMMRVGECVMLGTGGQITGAVGETITHDFTISSMVLGDDTVAQDPNPGNNTIHNVSSPIIELGDIAISTRLKTSGTIQNGSPVEYEVTITNIGEGDYFEDNTTQLPLGLYFIMPAGSSLDSVIDTAPNDNVSIANCGSQGDTANLGPGAAPYPGTVAGCLFNTVGAVHPGDSYKFNVNLTAGSSFASGQTGVWAIALADEPDVMRFQVYRSLGPDMFIAPSNNYVNLVYDDGSLQASVVRCNGQSEITTDGTGCFDITFNKDIPDGEFDETDINLDGKGIVSGFTQTGARTWRVNVSDIAQGSILTLALNQNGVLDFSAVSNNVQVLGENTFRYEVPSTTSNGNSNNSGSTGSAQGSTGTTSAKGTLASTGLETNVNNAYVLLLLGMILLFAAKFKKLEDKLFIAFIKVNR